MGLVAIERLRWGDGHIEPGSPVPEGEVGRDYAGMLLYGQVAEHAAIADVEALTTERDEAVKRAEDAEKAVADANETVKAAQDALAAAEQVVTEANATITARDEHVAAAEARIAELEKDVETLSAPAAPPAPDPAPAPVTKAAKPKPGK